MLLISAISDSEFVVPFEQVPEYSAYDKDEVIQSILDLRATDPSLSFGAYVIRNATKGLAVELTHALRSLHQSAGDFVKDDHLYSNYLGLHTDEGLINDASAHFTFRGRSDARVLTGSQLVPGTVPSRKRLVAAGDRLLDDNIIDQRIFTRPSRPLKTSLAERDLMLFDASQPHVFRNITTNRHAISYYYERPEIA